MHVASQSSAAWHAIHRVMSDHMTTPMLSLQELRAKLLAEAEQSARQNAAVAMRWADLFSIEVPQVRAAEHSC